MITLLKCTHFPPTLFKRIQLLGVEQGSAQQDVRDQSSPCVAFYFHVYFWIYFPLCFEVVFLGKVASTTITYTC